MYANIHVSLVHTASEQNYTFVANRVLISKTETTLWLDNPQAEQGEDAGKLVVDRAHWELELTANF